MRFKAREAQMSWMGAGASPAISTVACSRSWIEALEQRLNGERL